MHPFITKTFGGLSRAYYIRQFLFSLIFPALILFALSHGTHPISVSTYLVLVLNTLLYPYSRFVYESVVDYLTGKNVFFINAIILLFVKLVTMALCWSAAVFIAPVGLLYLYFHHSRTPSSE